MELVRRLFRKDDKPVTTGSEELAAPLPALEDGVGGSTADENQAPSDDEATLPPQSDAVDHHEAEETAHANEGSTTARRARPLSVGCSTHVGRVRKRNEDSALVISAVSMGDSALPGYGLFIVADGMGGHSEGQQASQTAARVVARDVMDKIFPPYLDIGQSGPTQPIQLILADALQTANWQVQTNNRDSGTTLTAALILGERLYVAHVGDSRAYVVRDVESPAELLTLDHSLVQRLQDTGQISAEEAAIHPQRNVLYRAIGQGDKLEVDTFSRPIPRPSWLLLCSDGLWGVVSEAAMRAAVTLAATPQQACDELVEAALGAGGPDNISVVVARFD